MRRRTLDFARGYERGARDMSADLREALIVALVNDAVISTNLDTDTLEHIVQVIEEV